MLGLIGIELTVENGELKARRGPARFLSGLVGLELIRSYYFIIRELKPDEVRQDSRWALSGLS